MLSHVVTLFTGGQVPAGGGAPAAGVHRAAARRRGENGQLRHADQRAQSALLESEISRLADVIL